MFPFSIFVLILHVPTRLTELGNTALSRQSHHNNSAPREISWMEVGATAALDSFVSFCFCFWAFVLTHELCFLSLHHSASAVPLTSILSPPLNTRLCLSYYSLISQDSSLPSLCPKVFAWWLPYIHSPLTLVLPLLVTEKTKLILVSNQFCFCLRGKMLQEVVAPNLTIRRKIITKKKKCLSHPRARVTMKPANWLRWMIKKCWGETGYVNCFTFGRIKVIKLGKRETTEILTNWLSYMWAMEQFRSPGNPRQRNTQPLASPFLQDSTGRLWKDWEPCLCSEDEGGAPGGPSVLRGKGDNWLCSDPRSFFHMKKATGKWKMLVHKPPWELSPL